VLPCVSVATKRRRSFGTPCLKQPYFPANAVTPRRQRLRADLERETAAERRAALDHADLRARLEAVRRDVARETAEATATLTTLKVRMVAASN
jgi:hypothetical protein